MTANSLKQQLGSIKKQITTKGDFNEPKKASEPWSADGQHHINMWERGKTELGVFMSHGSPYPFTHPIFGKFNNMECFWKYIQSEERDDRIRVMSGISLRKFGRGLKILKITNFRAIIMDSNYQKLLQYPDMALKFIDSDLPLESYYINKVSRVRIRPTFFGWYISGMEEIRTALKEGREPDFDYLLDIKGSNIYDYAVPGGIEDDSSLDDALKSEFAKLDS